MAGKMRFVSEAAGSAATSPFTPKSVTGSPYANRHKNARPVPGIFDSAMR